MAVRRGRKRVVTPEDLTRFEYLSNPQISPDGRDVIFVKKHAGEASDYVSNLWMVDVSGDRLRQFTDGGKDTQPRWSPDGSRVAFLGSRDKHRPQIYIIDRVGGTAMPLTNFPEGTITAFKWSPDGRSLAVAFREQDPDWTDAALRERKERGLSEPPRVIEDIWYRLDGDGYFNAQRFALWLVDAGTGMSRTIYEKDTLGEFSFDFSPDSTQLAITTNRDPQAAVRPWKEEIVCLEIATGRITKVPHLPEGPKTHVLWSPDGRRLAYAGRAGRDGIYSTENLELLVCDPVRGHAKSLTGKEDHCLLSVAVPDVAEAIFSPWIRWSRDCKRIFMRLGWHGEAHLASVPAAGGPITLHTSGPMACEPGNLSADGKLVTMTISGPTKLGEVHVGRVKSRAIEPRQITDFNGSLFSEFKLATPKEHWIKAADGHPVQLWALKPPPGVGGGRMPAVLEIHGGPHAQYVVSYFHEFQVLAAQGYTVFFSNPRGSKGYGRDHCAAIRGRWGTDDWLDVQAVVEFIKSRPYVDPKRLGIIGGSYGGYMTNWAIGHSNAFAAAVTDRCVSNLVSMFGNSDFVEIPDDYWEGNAWDRPEARWEQSPIKYFNNVNTPTLVIHSAGDLRCNIEQAEEVFTALKLRRVPARFVRYPASASHGMSRDGPPDLRVHRLNQILEWWRTYLKA